jgi:hypothetical protein
MHDPDRPIPRTLYALAMTGATALALASAWAVGGDGPTRTAALAALGVGSVCTFAPAALSVARERWGLVVAGASMARMLAIIAAGGLFAEVFAVAPRAYVSALLVGGGLVLAAETVTAILLLSRTGASPGASKRSPAHDPTSVSAPDPARVSEGSCLT